MADEYQIFTPGKFKRLRSFNILNYYGAQGKLPRLIEMTTRCATNLSLSGTTDRMHVVKWSGISEESEMLVALVSIKTLANIQVLELPKCVFQFSEMVIALRALTHVKRLWFSLGKKPASVDDIRMPKLPDYITSNCYPVGKFLYSVTFDIESKASAKQMATAAMLFAVASPSLVRVEVPNAAEQEFASEIKTSVAKRPFVKYAERVKSLIKSI
ncbi:hypothetical protein LPJ73_004610 [Coemansia sp. RSA 2703]|nr:hypothetical protein LPJ73_004610 [Coemansia sp. RSA 2703]